MFISFCIFPTICAPYIMPMAHHHFDLFLARNCYKLHHQAGPSRGPGSHYIPINAAGVCKCAKYTEHYTLVAVLAPGRISRISRRLVLPTRASCCSAPVGMPLKTPRQWWRVTCCMSDKARLISGTQRKVNWIFKERRAARADIRRWKCQALHLGAHLRGWHFKVIWSQFNFM